MGTSCFDTDFASQMKLTNLPLIHCFEFYLGLRIEDGVSELKDLFHAFWRFVKGNELLLKIECNLTETILFCRLVEKM